MMTSKKYESVRIPVCTRGLHRNARPDMMAEPGREGGIRSTRYVRFGVGTGKKAVRGW